MFVRSTQRQQGAVAPVLRVALALASGVLALCLGLGLLVGRVQAVGQARETGVAELGEVALQYSIEGQGPATVVFENDVTGDQRAWSAIAPRVARFARVVTYDRAGHGWSPPGHPPRDPASIARELDALLRKIGAREPFVLVALGHGGVYAREFASERPDAVRRLILIDTPHPDFVTRRRALVSPHDAELLRSKGDWANEALAPIGMEELAAIDSVADAEAWAALDSVPTVIITAGRHEWLAGTAADLQELLWLRTQRELVQNHAGATWILMDATGPAGVLAQPDSLVETIRAAVVAAQPQPVHPRFDIVGWLLMVLIPNWSASPPRSVQLARLLLGTIGIGFVLFRYIFPLIAPHLKERYLDQLLPKLTKHKTHREWASLYDVVPRFSARKGRAVRLLESCNRDANQLYRRAVTNFVSQTSPEGVLPSVWESAFDDSDWRALRDYVEPVSRQEGVEEDALDRLKRSIASLTGRPLAGELSREVELRGASGSGKSTLLHRLYFDLTGADAESNGARRGPVPMLFQPRALRSSEHLQRLREAEGGLLFRVLIEIWLENRHIDVLEFELGPLVEDFAQGLKANEIVVLLDGKHVLRSLELEGKLKDTMRYGCWVTADRGDRYRSGRHETFLQERWTLAQVETYVRKRWANNGGDPAAASHLLAVLRAELSETHWLLTPRNLDKFLGNVETDLKTQGALPSDDDLKSRCRGEADFLRQCFKDAVCASPAGNAEELIEAHLFEIAAAQVKGASAGSPSGERAMVEAVATLSDVVTVPDPKAPESARLREEFLEFFYAGYLAHGIGKEWADCVSDVGQTRWSRRLTRFVVYWLGNDARGIRHLESLIMMGKEWAPDDAIPPPVEDVHARTARANALRFAVWRRMAELHAAQPGAGDTDLRRMLTWSRLDLSGARLSDADLHLMRFESCSFDGAALDCADLSHAVFRGCSFRDAELASADASGAEFLGCRFQGAHGRELHVEGLQIEGAIFGPIEHGVGCDTEAEEFERNRADRRRSRYRGEFGKRFLNAQHHFLGPDLERLEREEYRPLIAKALRPSKPGAPVYLVDLMAGGSGDRIVDILKGMEGIPPQVRVLAIDRDAIPSPRLVAGGPVEFRSRELDIGSLAAQGSADLLLNLDLRAELANAYELPAGSVAPDVIIAKKAIHELPVARQKELLRRCRDALRPGGTFVLFADTPGGLGDGMGESQYRWLNDLRHQLQDPATSLEAIRGQVLGRAIANDLAGQALFANLWILLKDWANENTHELADRYFASAGELQQWAVEAGFELGAVRTGHYDLTVALFNEEGIRNALHHVKRNGSAGCDETQLREWLVDVKNPRQQIFREFAERNLANDGPLAEPLHASDTVVDFQVFDDALHDIRVTSRTFQFPVYVMEFVAPA